VILHRSGCAIAQRHEHARGRAERVWKQLGQTSVDDRQIVPDQKHSRFRFKFAQNLQAFAVYWIGRGRIIDCDGKRGLRAVASSASGTHGNGFGESRPAVAGVLVRHARELAPLAGVVRGDERCSTLLVRVRHVRALTKRMQALNDATIRCRQRVTGDSRTRSCWQEVSDLALEDVAIRVGHCEHVGIEAELRLDLPAEPAGVRARALVALADEGDLEELAIAGHHRRGDRVTLCADCRRHEPIFDVAAAENSGLSGTVEREHDASYREVRTRHIRVLRGIPGAPNELLLDRGEVSELGEDTEWSTHFGYL